MNLEETLKNFKVNQTVVDDSGFYYLVLRIETPSVICKSIDSRNPQHFANEIPIAPNRLQIISQ